MNRIVVLGLMVQYPLGGMAWQVLQRQARAARAIALEFFEARVLLPPLLEAAGL